MWTQFRLLWFHIACPHTYISQIIKLAKCAADDLSRRHSRLKFCVRIDIDLIDQFSASKTLKFYVCMLSNFSAVAVVCLTFSKKSFRNNISDKWFGSRSGPTIWVKTAGRGYQQATKVAASNEGVEDFDQLGIYLYTFVLCEKLVNSNARNSTQQLKYLVRIFVVKRSSQHFFSVLNKF